MTQEILNDFREAASEDDQFAERMKEETRRANAMRRAKSSSGFVEVVDSDDADTPFTERYRVKRNASTADSRLSNDNIVDALKEGTAEKRDMSGNHVGWENNRLDLLLDSECRRLLDVLPYTPSREETLANILRRECRNLKPEDQYRLACLDKNIDRDAILPMLIDRKAVEQKVPTVEPSSPTAASEWPAQPVQKQASQPTANVEVTWIGTDPMAGPYSAPQPTPPPSMPLPPSMPMPTYPAPQMQPQAPLPAQPLNLPFRNAPAPRVPLMQEKTIMLSCPIGRYRIQVLDVIQNPGYVVIIQREDTSLLISFDANHTTYRIDAVDADLEFSGISFQFNGAVYTVMVTK